MRPPLRAAIDAHVRLLLAWNSAINLTALREPDQIARGHVIDSLTAASMVERFLIGARQRLDRSVLDLGSGGGFPGLPLAFAVGAERIALVDSVHKKAAFLRAAGAAAAAAVSTAGEPAPAIEVLAERAEDLADEPEHRARYALVVARAVGSMAVARRTGRRNALGAVQGGVAWLLLFIYDAKAGLRRLRRAVGLDRRG